MTAAVSPSPGSERYLGARDVSRLSGRDPSSWTVEEVMQFIREADPQLGPHADLFRKHVSASVCVCAHTCVTYGMGWIITEGKSGARGRAALCTGVRAKESILTSPAPDQGPHPLAQQLPRGAHLSPAVAPGCAWRARLLAGLEPQCCQHSPCSSWSPHLHLVADFSWQETCSEWDSLSALLPSSPVPYKRSLPRLWCVKQLQTWSLYNSSCILAAPHPDSS